MRVLFTSLFFGLVAILTLASHPPVEAISRAFRNNPTASNETAAANTPASPTGIIPVSALPEQPSSPTSKPAVIPEPIAVPDIEIAATPETTQIKQLETEMAIAAAPEAILSSEVETLSSSEIPAAEPKTPPTSSQISDTPENRKFIRSLNLHAVYFGAAKTDLPANSREGITKAAARLASLPDGLSVIVGGHTDAHSEATNAPEIGDLRARTILDALIAAGAPSDRLEAAHYPAAGKRKKASDAWRDRRVEFHLFPPR